MISSFRNPLIKQIKHLHHKKYRLQEGVFFMEGIRAVLTAVEQGAAVEALVYAPDLLTSAVAFETIAAQQAKGMRCEAVTAELFQNISERDNPTGLGALVRSPVRPLNALPITPDAIFVALVDIADPGNLGTILRTLDATGASGLILVGHTTDVGHPTAAKASMGTLFTIPIATATMAALLKWIDQEQIHAITTTAHAGHTHWSYPYQTPLLLIMGSEKEGIPAEIMEATPHTVTIPMYGQASSLNLAIATSVLLYEVKRYYDHPR